MSEDNILREIQSDIAQEKYTKIFTEHGKKLIIAAVSIVVLTGALTIYKNHQAKKSRESGTLFMEAIDEGDTKKLGEVIAKGQKAYAPMAALIKAKLEKSKPDEAIKTLDGIINSSYEKAFREKAAIDKAFILINKKADSKEIIALLDSVSQEDSVFRATALELKASYLLENGDKKQAIEILTNLSQDKKLPLTLQDRAKHILATVHE